MVLLVALSPALQLPGDGDFQGDNSSEEAKPNGAASSVLSAGLSGTEEATSCGRQYSVRINSDVEEIKPTPASPNDTARGRGHSHFVVQDEDDETEQTALARLAKFMDSTTVEWFVGIVVGFNCVLILIDTDSRADYLGPPVAGYPGLRRVGDSPEWVVRSSDACFGVYCVELVLRLISGGRLYVRSAWGKLDIFIILMGFIGYILERTTFLVNMVRLCRVLRMLRFLKLFKKFDELLRLIGMMGCCIMTMLWSMILLMVFLIFWGVVAVEFLNDPVQTLAASEDSPWQDCIRCQRSFSSVWHACLTLFQTIVGGDSWGFIAVPVMEAYPWTAVILASALMSVVFGVLNLITAVIIDVFAERREQDLDARAGQMEREEMNQKKALKDIFAQIDEDGSGSVTLEEVFVGARRNTQLRHWLRVIDIDGRDLEQLFDIVDQEGKGSVDPIEFVEAMYRMRNADARTTIKFVRHSVTKLEEQNAALIETVNQMYEIMKSMSSSSSFPKCPTPPRRPSELLDNSTEAINSRLEDCDQVVARESADLGLGLPRERVSFENSSGSASWAVVGESLRRLSGSISGKREAVPMSLSDLTKAHQNAVEVARRRTSVRSSSVGRRSSH